MSENRELFNVNISVDGELVAEWQRWGETADKVADKMPNIIAREWPTHKHYLVTIVPAIKGLRENG